VKKMFLPVILLSVLCLLDACGGGSSMPALPPLVITSATPPGAVLQAAYDGGGSGFLLTASGGKTPYTWNWAGASGSSLPPGLNLSQNSISGTPTASGIYHVLVTVRDSQSTPAQTSSNYVITIALPYMGRFTPSGNMVYGRAQHTATLLNDGRVLVTGGNQISPSSNFDLNTAELYDPTTGSFAPAGNIMETTRFLHTATLLNTGEVLITGGENVIGPGLSELFDPVSGTFKPTGGMAAARLGHAATLLNNGNFS